MSKTFIFFLLLSYSFIAYGQMHQDFDYLTNIDPSIIIQPRYAITGNFIGEIVDGYKAQKVVLTKLAGYALKNVQSELRSIGYSLVVYDAYRPQKGVDNFVKWSKEPEDFRTKEQFYPYINKEDIIPKGYVASRSGHSRGSTIDLTIIALDKKIHKIQLFKYQLNDGSVIVYRDDGTQFMGSHFDYFGEASHHDTPLVNEQCTFKRQILRKTMKKYGFSEYKSEWWHYTLLAEPFPNTYFDFDII